MKRLLLVFLLSFLSFNASAAVVFSQPPDGTGALIPYSWVFPDGTDADMYAYDSFIIGSNQAITEIRWRGGHVYGAPYGHVFDFSVTFYESIAGGSQPHVNNPQLPEIYLAYYMVGGAANETYVGTFGGTAMYDYSFVLPTPFSAAAGVKYWVRVEGYQNVYPDWGMAVGTGGDGQHFEFSTGAAMFFFASGDTAFSLLVPGLNTGDLNCDNAINAFDIDPFVLALTNPDAYGAAYPNCNILNADVNCDGAVNAFDIDPIVQCLTVGCPPCP